MAALIDATTGYNAVTDFGTDDTEDPHSGTLSAAATGPQPYDDFNETNSAEDNLDSGSSLQVWKLLGTYVGDLLTDGEGGSGTDEVWGVIE